MNKLIILILFAISFNLYAENIIPNEEATSIYNKINSEQEKCFALVNSKSSFTLSSHDPKVMNELFNQKILASNKCVIDFSQKNNILLICSNKCEKLMGCLSDCYSQYYTNYLKNIKNPKLANFQCEEVNEQYTICNGVKYIKDKTISDDLSRDVKRIEEKFNPANAITPNPAISK